MTTANKSNQQSFVSSHIVCIYFHFDFIYQFSYTQVYSSVLCMGEGARERVCAATVSQQ